MKKLLLLILLALGLSAEAQQTCFGSSCSSSGSSTITPSTPTSGFTANTLIRTDGTNFLSGPKYASTGDLSLLFGVNRCMDSGGSDAYSCALSGGSLTAYGTGGLQITLRATTANTGTATLDVDGLGAKTITRADGSTLVTGDITANGFLGLVYDGTNFRMLSTPAYTSRLSGAANGVDITGVSSSGVAVGSTIVGGTGTSAGGVKIGSYNGTIGALWASSLTPSTSNYGLGLNSTGTFINGPNTVNMAIADGTPFFTSTATASTLTTVLTLTKTPVHASTVPAVSNTSANSCGTTAATIAGTAEVGRITVGATSGTSCTLTFSVAAPTARECWARDNTTGLYLPITASSTTVSVVTGTFGAGDILAFGCSVY